MRPRSIRVRLTGWYLAVLATILVLFSGGVYLTMRRSLREQLDDSVEHKVLLVQQLITFDDAGRPALSLGADDPELDDEFQRLFDPSGAVLYDNSQAFGDAPVDPSALERARDGGTHRGTVGEGADEARVITMPVRRDDGELAGILQAGQATEDLRETLRNLLLILAVALPSSLVLASFGGWWLSSRALAPIDRVTRAAREITARDLSRRLKLDLPDDEVGRLARTFDDMIARLDAAFERQRRFTADASHELRTPLTAIRGQIDVALERPREPREYQRVLATVNAQVDRMTRLVGGLLMLARSDAGAIPLERERIDVADLVESVAEQIRPIAREKGLEVQVQGDGVLTIEGDQDLLLQLLINLADNAVKYTAQGSVTLGWRSGAGAEMFVRDTAGGIPPEHRERIFERFYRIDAARPAEAGGAGLGLSIARWIAEAHGGALTVTSDESGSTFTAALPPPAPASPRP